VGLRLYDALAGRRGLGRSRRVGPAELCARVPNVEARGLRGGVTYVDGRFDDARLLIHLARTAAEQGAVLVNRARVTGLTMDRKRRAHEVVVRDDESGRTHVVTARGVVNATGAFADGVRRLDDPAAKAWMAPSQGVHLVLDGSFLGGETALLVPRTEDGRVLFVIPWHGRALVGTTDTAIEDVPVEPRATSAEIDFLLDTAGRYLARAPRREDVLSVFTGIRPLVRSKRSSRTAALSRDHQIEVSASGLLTIAGGKWTTYRQMAEDAVDAAARLAGLPRRRCRTRNLRIHGHDPEAARFGRLAAHGSDAPRLEQLLRSDPAYARPLHPRLEACAGEVLWAAQEEMARTVDDVLCRRTPSLYLDARAAREAAPTVAALLAGVLGRDAAWCSDQVRRFGELAASALP
jgi:glycerol-3-phosphate dehydrogenase